MKILQQIAIVFALCLIGEGIASIMPIPIPSSVISMVLMLILLTTKVIKVDKLEEISSFLLKNMPFFFIPPTVMVIENTDLFKGNVAILLFIGIVTTIITFVVTITTVQFIMRLQENRERKNDGTNNI